MPGHTQDAPEVQAGGVGTLRIWGLASFLKGLEAKNLSTRIMDSSILGYMQVKRNPG